MSEWDAGAYATLSEPQFAWGLRVLERLSPRADERIADVGCGAGRLTALLAGRARAVLAVDRSANMLAEARARLAPFGARVRLVRADAAALPLVGVDAIFSTATFHWVLDHDALFRRLHDALVPGGRLVAQCGGGPNIARLVARLDAFAPGRAAWAGLRPWNFASAEETAARLQAAGFVEVETWLEPETARLDEAARYRAFIASIILRDHLARLPDEATRAALLDGLTAAAAHDDPPYSLDYWRLNLAARRQSTAQLH